MTDYQGNVPILGEQPKLKLGIGMPVAFIRSLDPDGNFTPEQVVANSQGQQAIIGRSNILSAEDLVDMVVEELREVIHQEIRSLLHSTPQ